MKPVRQDDSYSVVESQCHDTTIKPLQTFAQLVPQIHESYRESKSLAPQKLLQQLEAQAQLLNYEIAAIKIQSYLRRFFSMQRVVRMRRRLETFNQVTKQCEERYVEEMVLQLSLEISLSFIRNNLRYKRLMESIEVELLNEVEEMIEEYVKNASIEVVVEMFNGVIDAVMKKRGKQDVLPPPPPSPLLQLLDEICDYTSDSFIEAIAIESILEEAREHMTKAYAEMILQEMILPEFLQDVVQKVLWEVLTIQYGHRSNEIEKLVLALEADIQQRDGDNSVYRSPIGRKKLPVDPAAGIIENAMKISGIFAPIIQRQQLLLTSSDTLKKKTTVNNDQVLSFQQLSCHY